MPAYNVEAFVEEAITSVLGQTYEDFELLVIDDGSTDSTAERIRSFEDQRIRFVQREENGGLATVRNQLLAMARGEYLAWLDSDDWALPTRLACQLEQLDLDSGLVLCGAHCIYYHSDGSIAQSEFPKEPAAIRCAMFFGNPFVTSSVLMRLAPIRGAGLKFETRFAPSEDYVFWQEVLALGAGANLPEALVYHRLHRGQSSRSVEASPKKWNAQYRVARRALNSIGIEPTEAEILLHMKVGVRRQPACSREELLALCAWLDRLRKAGAKHLPECAWRAQLTGILERCCYASALTGTPSLDVWFKRGTLDAAAALRMLGARARGLLKNATRFA